MWANENWSRRWDGSDADVLIAQNYQLTDENALVDCFARHFQDPRYIRIDDRPLLMIYRPDTIPDPATSIARWRALFTTCHGLDPIFVMGQAFGSTNPRDFGMDGAIEFPPHKITANCPTINASLNILDEDFTAQVYDYGTIVEHALADPTPDFPLIRTAAPSWDNDARRQGHGLVMHGSTPALYERWLAGLIEQARATPFYGTPLVCINAWNEWAEGAYLEPDQHFGSAYLNATSRAIAGFERGTRSGRILLIGHDAFEAGAQHLLLHIGMALKENHGAEVMFILLEGGALLRRYRAIAPTEVIAPTDPGARTRLASLHAEGFTTAILNSAASAAFSSLLTRNTIPYALLLHELPGLLQRRNLLPALKQACTNARNIVLPAQYVQERLDCAPDSVPRVILPQGLYHDISFTKRHRSKIRAELGIDTQDRLIIGIGYADMRKGFDLFLQLWRHVRGNRPYSAPGPRTHFLWLGTMDGPLYEGLAPDIEYAVNTQTFHLTGQVDDVGAYLSAADAFALTSREDPYPSVVLEALSCGLPCCAFEDSGGIPELLATLISDGSVHSGHSVVPMGDLPRMARKIVASAKNSLERTSFERSRIARNAAQRFSFERYAHQLLQLARPDLPTISIVVPSYNYGHYLAARLASIFIQRVPVLEIIVLDDASSDNSVTIARETAREWGRNIRVIGSKRQSGSVFNQWKRATQEASGNWIWIAEADDLCEADHLSALVNAIQHAPKAVMAFCDSRTIDQNGVPCENSYKPYYRKSAGNLLDHDSLTSGQAFIRHCLSERNLILNVSSALLSRSALLQALNTCKSDLETLQIAGDWRLYVELLDQPDAEILYVAEPLNIHRRHQASATKSLNHDKHYKEIEFMHALIATRLNHDKIILHRQAIYRDEVAQQFNLATKTSGRNDKTTKAHNRKTSRQI